MECFLIMLLQVDVHDSTNDGVLAGSSLVIENTVTDVLADEVASLGVRYASLDQSSVGEVERLDLLDILELRKPELLWHDGWPRERGHAQPEPGRNA